MEYTVLIPYLSLYSPYYAEACNELVVPISASYLQGNPANCVDVKTVANRLQRCVRFDRPLGNELLTSRTRGTRVTSQ